MQLGTRAIPLSRFVGILFAAALGAALFSLGCGDHAATGPRSAVPLRVRVEFPEGASAKGAGPAPAAVIDQVRAFAWEVVDDTTQVLRDQAVQDIAPTDTSFSLVLTVPPAPLYRVRVEARSGNVVLFEGEAFVENVGSGETAAITLVLVDALPPAAPTGLTATLSGFTSVVLSWKDNAENETRYRVERRVGSEGSFAEIAVLEGSFAGTVTYTDENLSERTSYQYRVRAQGNAGFSDYSNIASARTGIGAPTGLAVLALTESTLRITWNYPADPGGFQLQRRTGTGAWGTMLYPGASTRSYNDGGLEPKTAYGYRLRAFTGPDTSAWSNEASGTTADRAPVCALSEPGHDFGTLVTGNSAAWSFTISNTGGGTLAGTVALASCGNGFSLTDGDGPFSLTAGQSRTVNVRFSPTTPGPVACTVTTGLACTAALSGNAVPPGACSVDLASIGFGTLEIGSTADTTFVITNTGGSNLAVPLGSSGGGCPAFTLDPPAGSYNLLPGASLPVTVRFAPTQAIDYTCTVTAGSGCSVALSGAGRRSPVCSVAPATLDFGTREAGTDSLLSFQITNTGGGTLTGSVVLFECSGFSLESGGGDFALGAGASRAVTVRFSPVQSGSYACTVATGTACSVSLLGEAFELPVCSVTPTSLDFGTVFTDRDSVRSVTVTNRGGGFLTGTAGLGTCSGFTVNSGGGAFSLGAGESRSIDIEFAPSTTGPFACQLDLGTDCDPVALTGTGELPPECTIEPQALVFDTLDVETSQVKSFTITNTGGGTVEGTVALPECTEFTLDSGAGGFSLGAGESHTVSVRFSPLIPGGVACEVTTGTQCFQVPVAGAGRLPPYCTLDTYSLDFGAPQPGTPVQRSFTITNDGGGFLTGSATESCPDFSIVSGGGPFSLGAQQSLRVTVEYNSASAAGGSCSVDLGTACGSVSCTAAGVPECSVSPATLNFGTIPAGTIADRTLTVTNSGGGVLTGAVSENCAEFTVFQAGAGAPSAPASPAASVPYSLGAGQSIDVTVRFQPKTGGSYNCTIVAGDQCIGVQTVGNASVCSISPGTYIDLGYTYYTGDVSYQLVTITNIGAGTLAGIPSESCPNFSLTDYTFENPVSSFALGPGQSYSFEILFTAPVDFGIYNCTVSLGPNCPSIVCTVDHSPGKPGKR